MKASLKPYEMLSRIYEPKESLARSPQLSYLDTLATKCRLSLDCVLDLACGTGRLLRQLSDTSRSKRVVGLDISEHMLAFARIRFRQDDNVRLVHGDFRSFSLGETFDTIMCNFDSLNYVEHEQEVASVFECVHNHLRNPGFFVFDVINEKHCLWSNGYSHYWDSEGKCKLSNLYEPKLKIKTTTIEFENGIETHRQIPLEFDTIVNMAKANRCAVEGAYADRNLSPISEDTKRMYFVLRKNA